MQRLLRTRLERAVVIGINDVLRMSGKGCMRRVVVDAQIEGPLFVLGDEIQRVVGDDIGEVAGLHFYLSITNHVRVVVFAAAG